MKTIFLLTLSILAAFPNFLFGQAPVMGTTSKFVLFSTTGAIGNTGISQVTGNVGTDNGAITAFGNVNGVMHNNDTATSLAVQDLTFLYSQLDTVAADYFPSATLGNGDTLIAGVYEILSSATLNGNLILDAKGDVNAVFIIRVKGAFSTSAGAKVILINEALACNVFWLSGGLASFGAGTHMKGSIVANSAIGLGAGVQLEGRALTTAGAVTINGVLAYLPIGCGSPLLTGPIAPTLNSVACYALFSSSGAVTNTGVSTVQGDVGSNQGLTTGFDSSLVNGQIHAIPDASTAKCAVDLAALYQYMDTMPYDIELLYPAQFGNNLVLTPHTYFLNAAASLTDTLFLNAQGDSTAVFVIKINGALTTSTNSNIKLINGAKSKNVYWNVDGAVTINNNSVFRGTLVCNNGALAAVITGVVLDGRALTTSGALNTSAISVVMPTTCESAPVVTTEPTDQIACNGLPVSFTVAASGLNLTYQWRRGQTNLNNGGNISGAKTNTLTINPVSTSDTASDYNVIVSSASMSDTSENASLTICVVSGVDYHSVKGANFAGVYPNPFSASINVKLNSEQADKNIRIVLYNSLGARVINSVVSEQLNVIDAGSLPSGIYFYNIISDGNIVQTGKIISGNSNQ